MPRKPRLLEPGDVVHARTRFVNEEFRIIGHRDREKIRKLIGRARLRTDITVLAYAIMSSHIHLLLMLGEKKLDDFYRSFHTALAIYLNGEPGRLGPVVAGRPWVDVVRGETIYPCLRYIHHNQKEAGAAASLRASDWTSHPVFAGLMPRPVWLDVARAAKLAGYSPAATGIAKMVAEMEAAEACDEPISYAPADPSRREIRRASKLPVEVGTPIHGESGVELPLVTRAEPPARPITTYEPADVIRAAARTFGLSADAIRARDRRHAPSSARAMALYLWCSVLDNSAIVMASSLGISESAASKLRRPGSKALARALPKLADAIANLDATESPDHTDTVR